MNTEETEFRTELPVTVNYPTPSKERHQMEETLVMLEHATSYGNASYYVLCVPESDFHYPATVGGKIKMLQEQGYIVFTHSDYESSDSDAEKFKRIDSMAITPKGEALLAELRNKGILGRIKKSSASVLIAITTSVLTIVIMKYLGLVK